MIEKQAAAALAALGHEARLRIFRMLVVAGPKGLTVGEVSKNASIPLSTLFHHLSHLERADLIRKQRDGRETHCQAQFPRMEKLIRFLTEDCCAGVC